MRAFRQPIHILSAGADEFVPVAVPSSQIFIQQIVLSGSGAFNLTVYAREFAAYKRRVRSVSAIGGFTTLDFYFTHPYLPGDNLNLFAAAGTPITGGSASLVTSVPSPSRAVIEGTPTIVADDYALKHIPIVGFGKDSTHFAADKMQFTMGDTKKGVPHIKLFPGDEVTIAGTGTAYDATHTVLIAYDNIVITNTAYNAAVNPAAVGRFILDVPSAAMPMHEVLPLTAASSNVVRYDNAFGKAASLTMEVKPSQGGPGNLYFKISASGNYYGFISGFVP